MPHPPTIRQAQVSAKDASELVREFHAAVFQPDMAGVIFFCSTSYDIDIIEEEMARLFAHTVVVGCSTIGEIGPLGCTSSTLCGASFPSTEFCMVADVLGPLENFSITQGNNFILDMLAKLDQLAPARSSHNTFAFQMVDAHSVREELVTRSLYAALDRIPILGGSTGDCQDHGNSRVYCHGRFHTDSVVVLLVSTPLPFKLMMAQHFAATESRMVVTAAQPGQRIVNEIDGLPAATAYAKYINVAPEQLGPQHFADFPLTVLIGGELYVRSISRILDDGGLEFFCAIDKGVVLRLSSGADIIANLEYKFESLRDAIGETQLIIGCDCILRRLELEEKELTERISKIFRENHVIGFATYGEQFRGIHVNQTFIGVAIGKDDKEAGHDE